jgi:hypothetical protein
VTSKKESSQECDDLPPDYDGFLSETFLQIPAVLPPPVSIYRWRHDFKDDDLFALRPFSLRPDAFRR